MLFRRTRTAYRSGKLQCPDWVPSSISHFLQERWPKMAPYWVVSLRDLKSGQAVKHFKVKTSNEKIFFDRFCGMGGNNPSIPDLKAYADLGNRWLVLEDRLNLELWPLLTLWRPWSCQLLCGTSAFCSLFFAWRGFNRLLNPA